MKYKVGDKVVYEGFVHTISYAPPYEAKRPQYTVARNSTGLYTFYEDDEEIRPATKLELLLNGIDTEQETSYTDNKENDT